MKTWNLLGPIAGILFCQQFLQAQTFTAPLQASTTGANPVDFEFRADGTLIAKGYEGVGTLLSTDEGVGTRMLWYPSKAAFRVGMVPASGASGSWGWAMENPTAWDEANIGVSSVAFGRSTMASGTGSMAWGNFSNAVGYLSTAMGDGAIAGGGLSLAQGEFTVAGGYVSVAMGSFAYASGVASVAMGVGTVADAYACTAIGRSNVGGGDPNTWVPTDPLFEIGNGGEFDQNNWTRSTTSNALTVYKNGNVEIQGVVTAAPGGDIPMFSGN